MLNSLKTTINNLIATIKRIVNEVSCPCLIRRKYILNLLYSKSCIGKKAKIILCNLAIVVFGIAPINLLLIFPLQSIVGVAILDAEDWYISVASIAILVWFMELRKAIVFGNESFFLKRTELHIWRISYKLGRMIRNLLILALFVIAFSYCVKRYGVFVDEMPALEIITDKVIMWTNTGLEWLVRKYF